ncbi:MAG: extracellular solute-binding protein [Deltaproteobacteria bacterium]|nr:extracellular solute-binding protein [Deltaproteobacteria bacterium]
MGRGDFTGKNYLVLFVLVMAVLLSPSFSVALQESSVKGARDEGTVVIYGSTQITQMNPLIDRFKSKYPFLNVRYFRGGSEKLVERIQMEARAGSYFVDVSVLRQATMLPLKERGLLGRYESPARKWVRDIHKDREGYWTGLYSNMEWVGYNTKLVPPAEAPRKHDDLLHPKWKGKMGLDPVADAEWYMSQLHILGKEKGRIFMRQLAKQDIQFRRGHSLLAQLLAAGEFPLILTLRDSTAFELIKKGAPIDWVAFEPVIPLPAQVLVIGKNAPHPNSARLFVDYALSREGQEVLKSLGRNSTRLDVEPESERVKRLKIGKIDWPSYLQRYNQYAEEFNQLFLKGN